MTARAILAMKEILPQLPIVFRQMYFPFLCRDIVKELPKEESELFFALVGDQLDVFKIGSITDDILGRIKYEAAIIGFTHWLAENRVKVLTDLLSVLGQNSSLNHRFPSQSLDLHRVTKKPILAL